MAGLLRRLTRKVVGEPLNSPVALFQVPIWKHPRLRLFEVWLFGGIFSGPHSIGYDGSLVYRCWSRIVAEKNYFISYIEDIHIVFIRFLYRWRGHRYHHCEHCGTGVCVNGVRVINNSTTESVRLTKLSQGSMSADLILLRESLRKRTERLVHDKQELS